MRLCFITPIKTRFFFFFSEIINRWLYYAQKQMGTNYLVLTLDIKN